MSSDEFKWPDRVDLSSDDVRLIAAYEQTAVPLDSLAYTDDFRKLVEQYGCDPSDEVQLRTVYRKLLALRKRGVLPRLYRFAESA